MNDVLIRIVYKNKKNGYGDMIHTSIFGENGLNSLPFSLKTYDITHIDKAIRTKDIEGKTVYENDIIEILDYKCKNTLEVGKVLYDDKSESFIITDSDNEELHFNFDAMKDNHLKFRKIGNIYLNPNFLV